MSVMRRKTPTRVRGSLMHNAEERINESERRFRETAELLPGIICETDLSLRLTYVNKKGLETFGYSPDEYADGIYIDKLILEQDRRRAAKDIANVLRGDFGNPAEYRLRRKDGSQINLLINTAPILKNEENTGLRYCAIDISDRIRAERKLKETEERFRRIFQQSPIGIALCRSNGAVSQMNKSFMRMFGRPDGSDGSGTNVFRIMEIPDEKKRTLDEGSDIRHEGWCDPASLQDNERNHAPETCNNSCRRFFEWRLTLFGDLFDREKTYLIQVQDITERRIAQEAAIQKAKDAVLKAEALVDGLRKELLQQATFHTMVSRSPEMERIFGILPEIARSSAAVLILGESGTGKELVARCIHELSDRGEKPFIAINCGALPDALLESELFGYKAGAFTDAKKDKPGKFALVKGGTLFLDEIGDISPAMQVKLLRVLQEKTFEPLGSTVSETADVRVVAATNRLLPEMVKSGKFREDLFYRINVLTIQLPPLRTRRCDIPLLCNHFISLFNIRYGKEIRGISSEALNRLLVYEFPGNIRELENIIEHSFVFCKGTEILIEHLPGELYQVCPKSDNAAVRLPAIRSFQDLEKMFIEQVLMETNGNRLKAAQKLGIDKSTLFRKMKKLGVAGG